MRTHEKGPSANGRAFSRGLRRRNAKKFAAAGSANLELRRKELELTLPGGVAQAIEFAYATPIGPLLHALPADRPARFRALYSNLGRNLADDDSAMGRMVTDELSAS